MGLIARTFALLLALTLVCSVFGEDEPQSEKDAKKKPAAKKQVQQKRPQKKKAAKKRTPSKKIEKEAAEKKKEAEQRKAAEEQKEAEEKKASDEKAAEAAKEAAEKKAAEAEAKRAAQKQAEKLKFTATDLTEVDEDFAFQGEYMGSVSPDPLDAPRAGLQVVALGDGQFEANLLRGGLPGAGWDRRMKEKLTGKRENNQLILTNEHWRVVVSPRSANLQQPDQESWGTIPKYHRISRTQDASPQDGATVLFDGSDTSHFQNGELTKDGLLSVGAITKQAVHDFQMHVEFRTPYMPNARGQARANSGIYVQQRYEVQILDSFGLEGAENECGGLYKQKRPDVNMCLPPLSWQTYDITFTACRWDADGKKLSDAQITVLHNGEPIHSHYPLKDKTGGGKAEGPEDFPILFQNHGNPVVFRNIWISTWGPGSSETVFGTPVGWNDE